MLTKNIRTKKEFLEVARELFAKHGKNKVTMNRISQASGKSRRTLYTYFKSKEDVYKAVMDDELNFLENRLITVSQEELTPSERLSAHIITHLNAIKEAIERNGSLRADFFHDIYEVERARRKIDHKEAELISQILKEGVEQSEFKPIKNIALTALIILQTLKGIEIPYIRLVQENKFEQNRNAIVDFILSAIEMR